MANTPGMARGDTCEGEGAMRRGRENEERGKVRKVEEAMGVGKEKAKEVEEMEA